MEEGVVGWCQRSATGNNGGSKCGRWNPTAEQVKVLTDLFKSGLRTPSTDQIQKISCQLSSMGKIESKNVFYWFQNHKARERHHTNKKRRRHALNILTYTDNCSEAAAAETVSARTLDKDRGIETLELFPLTSSSSYSSSSTWIARRDYHKESAPFSLYSAGNESLLDLRLGS